MDINYIIPDSPNDLGAIWFWVIEIIFVIIAINLYLYYRETSKHVVKTYKNLNTQTHPIDYAKKTEEERLQELAEIRNKVDKIIENEKK
jgi:hypothetical protein